MKDTPVLRSHATPDELLRALGGLHYIKGNTRPYFTLTHEHSIKVKGRWQLDSCGARHEEILELWPELKPLADLHLSDIDGVPMYAKENGYYWIAGAAGGLGEEYHGGGTESPERCREIAAKHFRVGDAEIEGLIEGCSKQYKDRLSWSKDMADFDHPFPRSIFNSWIESKKVQWKMDALDCISKLNLQVFGDPWRES